MKSMNKVYDKITAMIVSKLEAGVVPWHRPWAGGEAGSPRNLVSNRRYRSINMFLLTMSGHRSGYWLTYKQARELGGHVRAGERGTAITFFKVIKRRDATGDGPQPGEVSTKPDTFGLLRWYTVFNVAQCDGLTHKRLKAERERWEVVETTGKAQQRDVAIGAAQAIWDTYTARDATPPTLTHTTDSGAQRAFWSRNDDAITVPQPKFFDTIEEYYGTLFHEGVHSTGIERRCNRDSIKSHRFGDKTYSYEELVAEMGAAMLCGVAGIEDATLDNSASYLQAWIEVLKADPSIVIKAGSAAQKACDYMLNVRRDETGTAI